MSVSGALGVLLFRNMLMKNEPADGGDDDAPGGFADIDDKYPESHADPDTSKGAIIPFNVEQGSCPPGYVKDYQTIHNPYGYGGTMKVPICREIVTW